jgi:tetratricopeptide (TPR) repeat protein
MLFRVIIIWVFFLGIAPCVQGQQTKLDSLLASVQSADKKNIVVLYHKIADYYKRKKDFKNALIYNDKEISAAENINQQAVVAKCYKEKSMIYGYLNEYENALLELRKGLISANNSNIDTVKADIYDGLAKTFNDLSQKDSTNFYINKAIKINQAAKNYDGLASNYFLLGDIAISENNADKGITYYEKSLEFSKLAKTDESKEAKIFFQLGWLYRLKGEYATAIEKYLKTLSIAEKLQMKDMIAFCYSAIGTTFTRTKDFDKSLYYLQKAAIAHESGGIKGIKLASFYLNFGSYYDAVRDNTNALLFKEKAVAIFEKIPFNRNIIPLYGSIGSTYLNLMQFEKAMEYNKKGLQLAQKIGDSLNTCAFNLNIGQIFLNAEDSIITNFKENASEKYNLALKAFNETVSIATKNGYKDYLKEGLKYKSNAYELQKDFKNAFLFYQEYINIKDSVNDIASKQKINRLEVEYEFGKKEDSLKIIQANTNAALQRQSFLNKEQQQNLTIKEKELLLNKQTILNSNQQLSILNKDKELQHLAYLKTQADLQTEQLLKGEKETQLTLVQKEKLLETAKVKDLSQRNEFNILKRKQQLGYGLAALATLLFGGLYLFNRNKNKQAQLRAELAKEKAEQQTKEAEFQKSLTDVSLSALRSQMNPHFIFNCLNSIKLYTSQNDTVAASNYLTKFSKLIRMALENSRSETVNLQNEIESLELYIQMEAMRFKDKLKYTIDVDKNVDADFIEIPPMLLQPYIENAIWHGLMHKEEGGNIAVKIANTATNDALIITIEDDGVGREKAAQLRSKTATSHKSFGTKVTSERLELINKLYKTEASVTTTDVLKNNEVAGTLVTIKIPFE